MSSRKNLSAEEIRAWQQVADWLCEWILQSLKDFAETLWAQWEIVYDSLLELDESIQDFLIKHS